VADVCEKLADDDEVLAFSTIYHQWRSTIKTPKILRAIMKSDGYKAEMNTRGCATSARIRKKRIDFCKQQLRAKDGYKQGEAVVHTDGVRLLVGRSPKEISYCRGFYSGRATWVNERRGIFSQGGVKTSLKQPTGQVYFYPSYGIKHKGKKVYVHVDCFAVCGKEEEAVGTDEATGLRKGRWNAAAAAAAHKKKTGHFLKVFAKTKTKRVVHWLDNDPSQKSKKVAREIKKGFQTEKFIPPYSPDLSLNDGSAFTKVRQLYSAWLKKPRRRFPTPKEQVQQFSKLLKHKSVQALVLKYNEQMLDVYRKVVAANGKVQKLENVLVKDDLA
jgi:hypothetical protein